MKILGLLPLQCMKLYSILEKMQVVFAVYILYLKCHKIGILSHPLFLDNGIAVDKLSRIKNKELEDLVNSAASKKIGIESAYAFILLFTVLSSALWFSVPTIKDKSDYVVSRLIRVWYDNEGERCIKLFTDSFVNGYKMNDCERFVKNMFSEMLSYYLQVYQSLTVEIFNGFGEKKTIDEVLNSEEIKSLFIKIKKGITKSGNSSKYIKKLSEQYKMNEGTAQYTDFMNNTVSKVIENTCKRSSGITYDSMYKYLNDITERVLERGGLYYKNDILDGLILQHLYADKNSKIITFDKGMIEHLDKYSQIESTYQNSIRIINICTNPGNFGNN